ncbi:hypothetical protein OFAG_01254 [Oxalobacter formigenes HOxBLS]|uniref:PhnA-like protein n=2 Tax=Oxalobacter paraformigenes TaxID=556268 RepID=C3X4G5_9BURK|nr:hypothetical protein [Oxalobacter paraformigenes]EEO28101.1 hypothetical protein OFAG_01254 [Oxalobacter paraformigenes]
MTSVRIDERAINERIPASGEEAKRLMFPGIRWGAIFAGVVVGISLQTLLGILGVAGGLSSMSSVSSGESAGWGAMLWTMVSLLISAFAGSFLAARMSGSRRKSDGAMYGAVTWAVSMLLFAMILSTTAGAMLNGMFSAANTTVVYSGTTTSVSPTLASQLRQELGGELSAANLQQLQQYLQAGQREEAIVYLTSLGVESPRAVSVVNNAMNQIGSSSVIASEQLISPDQLIRAVTAAAWMVFIGVALSLIFSIGGGIMGAKYAYRSIWGQNGFPRMPKESKLID